MQLPYRKPGKYSQMASDYLLTPSKILDLQQKLGKLKSARLKAASEVARLAELGDFSENVEYQLAKGRLRGINQKILELEHQLNRAIVINQPTSDKISIGHTVTITNGLKEFVYRILGSTETDPGKGIISHTSPIGSSLLGKKVGDQVSFTGPKGEISYVVVKFE